MVIGCCRPNRVEPESFKDGDVVVITKSSCTLRHLIYFIVSIMLVGATVTLPFVLFPLKHPTHSNSKDNWRVAFWNGYNYFFAAVYMAYWFEALIPARAYTNSSFLKPILLRYVISPAIIVSLAIVVLELQQVFSVFPLPFNYLYTVGLLPFSTLPVYFSFENRIPEFFGFFMRVITRFLMRTIFIIVCGFGMVIVAIEFPSLQILWIAVFVLISYFTRIYAWRMHPVHFQQSAIPVVFLYEFMCQYFIVSIYPKVRIWYFVLLLIFAEIVFTFKPVILVIPFVRRAVLRFGSMKYVLMDVDLHDEEKRHESFQMFVVVCQGRISAYVLYILHILCLYYGPNNEFFANIDNLPFDQVQKTLIVAAVTVAVGIVQVVIGYYVILRHFSFNIAENFLTESHQYRHLLICSVIIGTGATLAALNKISGFLFFTDDPI